MHQEQKTPCSGILFFIKETSSTHILKGFKGPPRTIIFKKQWIHLACTETLETTTFKRQNAQELFMQIAIFQERGLSLHHASKRGLPTRDLVVRPLKILLQHAPKRLSTSRTTVRECPPACISLGIYGTTKTIRTDMENIHNPLSFHVTHHMEEGK